jgi:HTH-type transcriptional regulator, transcriptional repressor of NAD biosynthesis genes
MEKGGTCNVNKGNSAMKRFSSGVVIGKFYPPHKGHHFLIDTAIAQCEKVHVLICWKPSQTVPIGVRSAAIKEMHPKATVVEVEDILADDDTPGWAAYTVKLLGFQPKAVFTSEDYGDGYAKAVGAEHVMVDRRRLTVPCSGSMIRTNPLDYLAWVSPPIRAFYVKRICIVGAESTGKTTLAEHLALHYKTKWVPEYGREYCAEKWKDGVTTDMWATEDFITIAHEQCRREDALAREANKVLICDTDPFATGIWHERYLDKRSNEVESIANARKYDLYILTGNEIPFVQDGLRDGEHICHWMHNRFIEALDESHRPWISVAGPLSVRVREATRAIDAIIKNGNVPNVNKQ